MWLIADNLRLNDIVVLGLILLAWIGVPVSALVFSCIARARLPVDASLRTRIVANLAIIAPVLWTAAIIALIMYAASHF